jgi:hypothetical protein
MAAADAGPEMTNLAPRLEDLPGVASVSVDLEDLSSGGIRVRLEPGADEADVMERVRALLVAYGVRSTRADLEFRRTVEASPNGDLDVEVRITPIKGGARIEVIGEKVRSFRISPPNPLAITQGLADAWCQVVAKIPVEIVSVSFQGSFLRVVASDGDTEAVGVADATKGIEFALAHAVGRALGLVPGFTASYEERQASLAW